jgi:hypothetical protein
MAGKFGERDPIFLPSMFLPSLSASGDCFQQAIHYRNIADRKMLVHDLPIFLSSIFLSVLPPETKERKFEQVVKSAERRRCASWFTDLLQRRSRQGRGMNGRGMVLRISFPCRSFLCRFL